jgi:hypothetical protein
MPRFTNVERRIHVLCMDFAMKIILLYSGHIRTDMWFVDYLADVYLKECVVIGEKQSLS